MPVHGAIRGGCWFRVVYALAVGQRRSTIGEGLCGCDCSAHTDKESIYTTGTLMCSMHVQGTQSMACRHLTAVDRYLNKTPFKACWHRAKGLPTAWPSISPTWLTGPISGLSGMLGIWAGAHTAPGGCNSLRRSCAHHCTKHTCPTLLMYSPLQPRLQLVKSSWCLGHSGQTEGRSRLIHHPVTTAGSCC
jgi:hypothetical protein